MFRFNRAANTNFRFAKKKSRDQNLKKKKTHFPEEFFNKIWLKVEEHKYTYI